MQLPAPLRRALSLAAGAAERMLEAALAGLRKARAALEEGAPEVAGSDAPELASQTGDALEPEPLSQAAPPEEAGDGPAPTTDPVTGEPVVPPPSPLAAEVKTIDDAPVPVAAVGEEGAEEGAGAEVHVNPPWEGYDGMIAAEIRARLREADSDVLAAVVLYEGLGKRRSSVIGDAERRLARLASS